MLVDHEKVLLALKRVIAAKPSHGGDALLAEIARLEVAHAVEEGLPERALRLYGVHFTDPAWPSASPASADQAADGSDDRPASIGAGSHRPKEDTHEQHPGGTPRPAAAAA